MLGTATLPNNEGPIGVGLEPPLALPQDASKVVRLLKSNSGSTQDDSPLGQAKAAAAQSCLSLLVSIGRRCMLIAQVNHSVITSLYNHEGKASSLKDTIYRRFQSDVPRCCGKF